MSQKMIMAFKSKEDVTAHQVNTLLQVIGNLYPFLTADPRDPDGPAADGGVLSVAFATLSKATERLDKILDDDSRWALTEVNALHEAVMKTQKIQQEFLLAQTDSAKEILRPSFQNRPTLYVADGKFFAVWGSPALVGVGDTPHAALLDFDAAFLRRAEEQIQVRIEEEPIPQPPLSVKPTRKKK